MLFHYMIIFYVIAKYVCISRLPSSLLLDIDECSLGISNCSHGCNNTDGGFICTCEDGYTLTNDSRTCSISGIIFLNAAAFFQ